MKTKFTFVAGKAALLLLLVMSFSYCRRGGNDCPEITRDSTHFDSSELAKIPDWLGDSLFFYSDAGDTAYMVCTEQYGKYKSYGTAAGSDPECGQNYFPYYPEYGYYYLSNHPDLNGIRVLIYKESNAYQNIPGKPTSFLIFYTSKSFLDGHLLSDLQKGNLNDSITIYNGSVIYGWKNRDMLTTLNLQVGLFKINSLNSRKWVLFNYSLNK
jgi:hypothetical protein